MKDDFIKCEVINGRPTGRVIYPENYPENIPAAKVYISGSITKDPDYREHFRTAEEKLRALGMRVFNPAKFEADPNKTWEDYMRNDIAQLMTCRAIYLLKGWKKSRGARIEYKLAQALGLIIMREQ